MTSAKKFDAPFDQLHALALSKIDATEEKFLCQYTGQACNSCVSLPTFLCRENSKSSAPRGVFYDWGVLLSWLVDHQDEIKQLSIERYDNIQAYIAGAIAVKSVDDLAEYTAPGRRRLTLFGGDLDFETYLMQYPRPPAAAVVQGHTVEGFKRSREERQAKSISRPDTPSPGVIFKDTFTGEPIAVQRALVYTWPAMGLTYTRPAPGIISPDELTPFAQHTQLSVLAIPADSNAVTSGTLFAPSTPTKRQRAIIKKLTAPAAAAAAVPGKSPAKRSAGMDAAVSEHKRRAVRCVLKAESE